MIPDKIYFGFNENTHLESYCLEKKGNATIEYVNKDKILDAIRLAWGTICKDPFDCNNVFEELIDKLKSM